MGIKVGINGFGRIGRNIMRAALSTGADLDFVAVNDITDAKTLAHLLKYDSILGNLPQAIEAKDGGIVVGGGQLQGARGKGSGEASVEGPRRGHRPRVHGAVHLARRCGQAPRRRGEEGDHHRAGHRHRMRPSSWASTRKPTTPRAHHVVSNASCTTNCLAPFVKVLDESFGIKKGWMTTIHSYTNDQQLLDLPHKDMRRARAAALSMIPTTTGAAKAVGEVLPSLKGKLDGFAMRVPTPNVSVVDLAVLVNKPTTADEVNAAFREAAKGRLKGILAVEDAPLVSSDFKSNPNSSIIDSAYTKVMDKRLREGPVLVRQRVGLFEPLRGPRGLHGEQRVVGRASTFRSTPGRAGLQPRRHGRRT